MSANTYRGESPEKQEARRIAYGSLPKEVLSRKLHIVIAGACGDIHYLRSIGVPAKRIIACDREPERLEAARKLGVLVPPGDIANDIATTVDWAADKFGDRIGSINVDLCATLLSGAPILFDVASNAPVDSAVFLTFSYRRDGMARQPGETGIGRRRQAYLRRELAGILGDPGAFEFHPYLSITEDSQGSPMCMMVITPATESQMATQKELRNRALKAWRTRRANAAAKAKTAKKSKR